MSRKIIISAVLLTITAAMVALAACSNASASGAPPNPAGTTAPAAPAIPAVSPAPSKPVETPLKALTGRVKATWLTAAQTADEVSIPVSMIEKEIMVHFTLDAAGGKMPYMAYVFEGKTYVRADICPPCRSYNFSIEKDILICDTCGSRFKAINGEGISGACVNYPKAAVVFEVRDGNVVMKADALKAAYQDTLKPGLP